MAIKTTVDTLDGLPDGLKEFYNEVDGKFVLDVEGIDQHPDVSNLRNAYQRTKDSEKLARRELHELKTRSAAIPDDFDADLWNKAKSGDLEKGLVKVRKELEAKLEQEQTRSAGLEKRVRSFTVDHVLADALDSANISTPAYRRAAIALLKDAVKLDGDKVFVDSDMGPLDPGEYVRKWASTDEGKAFVTQPKGGGSKAGDPTVTGKIKSWADAKTPAEKVQFLKQQK